MRSFFPKELRSSQHGVYGLWQSLLQGAEVLIFHNVALLCLLCLLCFIIPRSRDIISQT